MDKWMSSLVLLLMVAAMQPSTASAQWMVTDGAYRFDAVPAEAYVPRLDATDPRPTWLLATSGLFDDRRLLIAVPIAQVAAGIAAERRGRR